MQAIKEYLVYGVPYLALSFVALLTFALVIDLMSSCYDFISRRVIRGKKKHS